LTIIISILPDIKQLKMETLIIDGSSLQAQSFLNFAKTLAFVKSVQML